MPLKSFICPDNAKILVSNCLKEGGCRMSERCATRSYLRFVATERPWTGKASTTQLIGGTLLAFLKITKEYSISPDSRAFAVHGTKAHAALEAAEDDLSVLELAFKGDDVDVTGISDVLEIECGKIILADYKTSGSFKVAKALGFKTEKEATGEVWKSGKRKGEPRMRTILVRKDEYVDRWEWEYQLNKYRIEAEKKLPEILAKKGIVTVPGVKHKIDEIRIQCVARDGNCYVARSRGVFRNVYYFKINIIPDKVINTYFEQKDTALKQALKQGYWDEICSAAENWDGIRCAGYCEVAEHCSFGRYLKKERQVEEMAIKGLSEVRRFPRLGKIRLGIRVKKVGDKWIEDPDGTVPRELDHFRLAPATPSEEENAKLVDEFKKLYGEKAKQIKIMLPRPELEIVFPTFYKRYGGPSLKCKGDGEKASCGAEEFVGDLKRTGKVDEFGHTEVECRGKECVYYGNEKGKGCRAVGTLQVLLPDLPGAGVWQITTGSINSIINIQSCLDHVKAMAGRFHMIPLKLERREQPITHDGKTRSHHILHIAMDFRLSELQRLAQIDTSKIALELPAPAEEKEDILFEENVDVNRAAAEEAEVVNEKHPDPETLKINEAQLKRLHTIASKAGANPNNIAAYLLEEYGIGSSKDILRKNYDTIIGWIKKDCPKLLDQGEE